MKYRWIAVLTGMLFLAAVFAAAVLDHDHSEEHHGAEDAGCAMCLFSRDGASPTLDFGHPNSAPVEITRRLVFPDEVVSLDVVVAVPVARGPPSFS